MNIDTLERTINKQAENSCPWCSSKLEIARDGNAYILGCANCEFEKEIDVIDILKDWKKKHPKSNYPDFSRKLPSITPAYYLWVLSPENLFKLLSNSYTQTYSEEAIYNVAKFRSKKEARKYGEWLKEKEFFQEFYVGGFCTIPLHDCPCCDADDAQCRFCRGTGKIWLDTEGRIIQDSSLDPKYFHRKNAPDSFSDQYE